MIAFYNYYCIFLHDYQHKVHRPSIFYFSVADISRKTHYIRKLFLELKLPQTQHQYFIYFYLKDCFETWHYLLASCFWINFKIYGSVVKSFAMCPREFLLSRETPYWRNALKISGAAPAAANMTLLFPEQSTSSQCNPAFNRI